MTSQGEGRVDLLVQQRFFQDSSGGVFVEVGAARPDFLSMSALFRAAGWQIIAIEPNPLFCQLQRDAGHEVLQYACADYNADDVPFSVVDSQGIEYRDGRVSFESFSSIALKDSYRRLRPDLPVTEIRVNIRTLDRVLQEHAPSVERIDVLSIDVEGWELEVLNGLSMGRYRPTVIILENFLDDPAYSDYMTRAGYVLWKHSAPNDVYVIASALPTTERIALRAYTSVLATARRARRAAGGLASALRKATRGAVRR